MDFLKDTGSWLPLVIIIIVFFLMRRLGMGGCCGSHGGHEDHNSEENEGGQDALEILNRRYAKGEISAEEYERMKEEIMRK